MIFAAMTRFLGSQSSVPGPRYNRGSSASDLRARYEPPKRIPICKILDPPLYMSVVIS